jgi:Domain of Unknown Function (DUF748)
MGKKADTQTPAQLFMQKLRRYLLASTAIILFLITVFLATLSWTLPWLIERVASRELTRPVHIESMSLRPWSTKGLSIELQGVKLGEVALSHKAQAEKQTESTPSTQKHARPGPLLTLKHLSIDLSWQSLRQQALLIDRLSVNGLHLHLARTSPGHYNIDDFIARAMAPKKPSRPFPMTLRHLKLSDTSIQFDDQVLGLKHQLTQLQLSLPVFSTHPSLAHSALKPHLAFQLNGAQFDSDAELRLLAKSPQASARLKAQDFDIKPYLDYWPATLPIKPLSGKLSAQLDVDYEQAPQAQHLVKLQSQIELDHWAWVTTQDQPLASWDHMGFTLKDVQALTLGGQLTDFQLTHLSLQHQHLELGLLKAQIDKLNWQGLLALEPKDSANPSNIKLKAQGKLNLKGLSTQVAGQEWLKAQEFNFFGLDFSNTGKPQLAWQSAKLQGLVAQVRRDETGAINWLQFLPKSKADDEPKKPSAEWPIDLRLGLSRIVGMQVHWTDLSVSPKVSLRLNELNASLSGVDNTLSTTDGALDPQDLSDLRLEAKFGSGAGLDLQGQLNPLAPQHQLDLLLRLDDLDLPLLSGYAAQWTGYSITRGKLDADLKYLIKPIAGSQNQRHQLQASNQLSLQHLNWSEHQAHSKADLPVRMATVLLRDNDGRVDLDIPIAGTLEEPDFSIASQIGHFFSKLFSKVLSAPFLMLADWFRGEPDQALLTDLGLQQLNFAPGSAALEPQTLKQMNLLAKALAQKPELSISITAQANAAFDRLPNANLVELASLRAEALAQTLMAQGLSRQRIYISSPDVTLAAAPVAEAPASAASASASAKAVEPQIAPPATANKPMASLQIGL